MIIEVYFYKVQYKNRKFGRLCDRFELIAVFNGHCCYAGIQSSKRPNMATISPRLGFNNHFDDLVTSLLALSRLPITHINFAGDGGGD